MTTSPYRILVLHGPNLNLLGLREPHIYGHETLAEINADLIALGESLGAAVTCRQSNHEGELVEWLQDDSVDAIIINPAAYSHTSIAIRDAIAGLDRPVYEVHLTNVHRREAFRHHCYCADVVAGRIMGFGAAGYGLALRGAVRDLQRAATGE